MDDSRRLAEITRAAVERAGERPPLQIWEDLIRKGFIDREGRVTRLIGGTAEPEPEAVRDGPDHSMPPSAGSRRTTRARGVAKAARRRR